MYLLLPPSEAKTPGGRGRPLSARADDGPLAAHRARAIDALVRLARGDRAAAATALALPPAVVDEALAADAAVLDSPTMPALRRYAGVVYLGLDLASLTPAERRFAARRTLVFSGLFGVVRGDEQVPDYRVPAKAVLPGLGVAGTFWRPVLTDILPGMVHRDLVVDLRSSDYAAMWRPDGAVRRVGVRVLSPVRTGYGVVSYNSKLAKGRLAAALVRREVAGQRVRSVEDVLAAWQACGGVRGEITGSGVDLYT